MGLICVSVCMCVVGGGLYSNQCDTTFSFSNRWICLILLLLDTDRQILYGSSTVAAAVVPHAMFTLSQ